MGCFHVCPFAYFISKTIQRILTRFLCKVYSECYRAMITSTLNEANRTLRSSGYHPLHLIRGGGGAPSLDFNPEIYPAYGFPQFLQTNACIAPYIKLRPFPSTSLRFLYLGLLIDLSFDTTCNLNRWKLR